MERILEHAMEDIENDKKCANKHEETASTLDELAAFALGGARFEAEGAIKVEPPDSPS